MPREEIFFFHILFPESCLLYSVGKMETRIRELESELDAENRRCADAQKNLRRSERKVNSFEVAFV